MSVYAAGKTQEKGHQSFSSSRLNEKKAYPASHATLAAAAAAILGLARGLAGRAQPAKPAPIELGEETELKIPTMLSLSSSFSLFFLAPFSIA